MVHITYIYIAFIIDVAVGDPHWFPHPVRGVGAVINVLESITVKLFGRNRFAGIVTGGGTVIISVLFVYYSIYFANIADETFGVVVNVFWLWAGISCRSLAKSADAVLQELKRGDICEARRALSMIVGRDTEDLTEEEIHKAVIETVSENSVDGIISPLFFAAVGGAPLLWAFKAVSTCDSMIGYKNERYIKFGTFSAKLDDAANYIPARLSVFLYMCAAWLGGYSPFGAYRIARRDAGIHSSPNSGIPEAAVSGALKVSLGGDSVYGGVKHKKELFGKEFPPPTINDIAKSIDLMWIVTGVMLALLACISVILYLSGRQ